VEIFLPAGAILVGLGCWWGLAWGTARAAFRWATVCCGLLLSLVVCAGWLNDQGGLLWLLLVPLVLAGLVLGGVTLCGLGFAIGTALHHRHTDRRLLARPIAPYAVLAFAIWGIWWLHPFLSRISDRSMIANFERHRSEFQQIVALADEDRRFQRIASTFTYPDSTTPFLDRRPPPAPLLPERWDAYRALFQAANVPNGIAMHGASISFGYWGSGILDSTEYLEYLYSPEPVAPLVESIDEARRSGACGDRCYRQIAESWYLTYWR
jgi:hypothetical protein